MEETRQEKGGRTGRSPRPVVLVLVGLALLGGFMAREFLGRWLKQVPVPPQGVEAVFTDAVARAGGGPPYIEILADGGVRVHREQEPAEALPFTTLTLLAWRPGEAAVMRIDYPNWFVRLKTSWYVNLGTLIAAARKDWAHLGLQVRYGDLRRRGPALLLDHRARNGARILLYTSASPPD